MSVSIPVNELKRVHELYVLLHDKKAFELNEYEDAGRVYKALAAALESASKDGESGVGELSPEDLNYVLNAMNVCSLRVGLGLQNYKLIAELFETLQKALKAHLADEEETKE